MRPLAQAVIFRPVVTRTPAGPAAVVVDATGRVRQVLGLRVADAAIFPGAISTPTNLTVLLVAERTAAAMHRMA